MSFFYTSLLPFASSSSSPSLPPSLSLSFLPSLLLVFLPSFLPAFPSYFCILLLFLSTPLSPVYSLSTTLLPTLPLKLSLSSLPLTLSLSLCLLLFYPALLPCLPPLSSLPFSYDLTSCGRLESLSASKDHPIFIHIYFFFPLVH